MSELTDLSLDDLRSEGDRLYVAAIRYVRAFERHEIDETPLNNQVSVGEAAKMLIDASSRIEAAFTRADQSGVFDD